MTLGVLPSREAGPCRWDSRLRTDTGPNRVGRRIIPLASGNDVLGCIRFRRGPRICRGWFGTIWD